MTTEGGQLKGEAADVVRQHQTTGHTANPHRFPAAQVP